MKGDPVATLKGPAEPGMNRVQWNMRGEARPLPQVGVAAVAAAAAAVVR